MWPIFALWDFWFWSLFAVLLIFEFVWTNKSEGIAGLLTPLGFMVVLFLFSSFNPFSWIAENWTHLWIYVLGYIVIGLSWSFFHWFRFVQKRADSFDEFMEDFRKRNNLKPDWFPEESPKKENMPRKDFDFLNSFWEQASHWKHNFERFYGSISTFKEIVPQASDNKDNLIAWMSLWPFDMTWMLLSDLLIEIWNWLFSRFKNAYQKISNMAFNNYIYRKTQIPAIQLIESQPNKPTNSVE